MPMFGLANRRPTLAQIYADYHEAARELRESGMYRPLGGFDSDGMVDIRESASASDFSVLLGNLMYRELIPWFNTVPQDWKNYVRVVETQDYRPRTLIVGAEAENLLFVGQNGMYLDSQEFDRYFQVQTTKFGRLFRVNRTVIMNDDLGYIREQPRRQGRAAARTLSQFVAQSILEANPNTFDGVALFNASHVAGSGTYSNLVSGASSSLTTSGISILQTICANMLQAKAFDGVLRPVEGDRLVVPPALKFQAMVLLRSATVVAAGGQTPDQTFPQGNPLQFIQPLDVVVDKYLTSATAFYVMADPEEIPVIVVSFLQGNREPQLLIQRPQMYSVAGGDDPYSIDFDDMVYKVRYEFGGAVGAWWGAYKSAGS